MSTLHVEFRSRALSRPGEFWMYLPEKLPVEIFGPNPHYERPTKTLILLHGFSGSATDWLLHTPAAEISMKYNLAIVMPTGGVSFYLDHPGTGNAYAKFICEDIPHYLQTTFGLAKSKEDTLIAGNSMGGFGAIHSALAYPEQFGCALGYSSALIVNQVASMTEESLQNAPAMADYAYYLENFGEPSKVLESSNNPEKLVKDLQAAGKQIPGLFMCCGTEDFLLSANRQFKDFLVNRNVPVEYREDSGMHNWDFWNKMFEPGVKWALEGK